MAIRYSVATGNYSNTSTWSASSGGAPGASVPVAGDTIQLEGGFTVTVTGTVVTGVIQMTSVGGGCILALNKNSDLTCEEISMGGGTLDICPDGQGSCTLECEFVDLNTDFINNSNESLCIVRGPSILGSFSVPEASAGGGGGGGLIGG